MTSATGMAKGDQYADGKAAEVWELYIGAKEDRTGPYKNWLFGLLRNHGCKNIIDVACGTGVDSMLLLEAGFKVTSTDASYQMLKYALKKRWAKRKEPAYDQWEIEEANWLNLSGDLGRADLPPGGYDAVLCIGNSFPHLLDMNGDKKDMRSALKNFKKVLKPGGILVVDHRNFDAALDTGVVPSKNVYYQSQFHVDIDTMTLHKNGKPCLVSLHYTMNVPTEDGEIILDHLPTHNLPPQKNGKHTKKRNIQTQKSTFTLNYYPHRLQEFGELVKEVFGKDAKHTVYGDFEHFDHENTSPSEGNPPGFFIHIIKNMDSEE